MKIAVIDGQGGGIGSQIVKKLRVTFENQVEIIALGTNEIATAAMLKAKANIGATGENAICETVKRVDIVVGPLCIVIPNSMMGELTPRMASAIASGECLKFLLPIFRDRVEVIGCLTEPLPHMVEKLVQRINDTLDLPSSLSI